METSAREEIRQALRPMFIRIENAHKSFISSVMEQFGKTEAEAEKVLRVYKIAKAVKLVPAMGRYDLKHGALWEMAMIDAALAYDETPKRKTNPRPKTPKARDAKPEKMTLDEARRIIGNQPPWAIRNMAKALSMPRALNTPEEERLLEAARIVLKARAA